MITLTNWGYGKERMARSPSVTLELLSIPATPCPITKGNVALRFCDAPDANRRYDLSLTAVEAREMAAA